MPRRPLVRTTAHKPPIHNRDHEHGAADPLRIHYEDVGGPGGGGGGGGIQFDTNPQAGTFLQVTTSDWMNIETEGSDPLNLDANGTGDINLYSAGGDITLSADDGVIIDGHGDNGIVLDADGNGDIAIHASGTANIQLTANSVSGCLIILVGLPTTDPGVGGALWNNGGVLNIS